jgi:hypothetical protein
MIYKDMDIDITPIDNKNLSIKEYINFTKNELEKHISLVKNKDYKRIAFTSSNSNNFKKFFEEILPLMFFLEKNKSIYTYVKYMSGDQKGDAIIDNKIIVEITKAQNDNTYISTQDILNHGYSFSPKGFKKNIISILPTKTQPYVYKNKEHLDDIIQYIERSIKNKILKDYPANSILLVTFKGDRLLLECDGEYFYLEQKIQTCQKGNFSSIYIIEDFLTDDLQPKWQLEI